MKERATDYEIYRVGLLSRPVGWMAAYSVSCTAATKDGAVIRSGLAGLALFGRVVAHEREMSPDGLWSPPAVLWRPIVGVDSAQ